MTGEDLLFRCDRLLQPVENLLEVLDECIRLTDCDDGLLWSKKRLHDPGGFAPAKTEPIFGPAARFAGTVAMPFAGK